MVHQNPPQLLCGHRVKMGAILPVNRLGLTDPKVGFVNYRSCLQGVLAVFAAHFPRGYPMQFGVDQIHQPAAGLAVTVPPPVEEIGDDMRFAIVFIHYSQL